MAAPRGAGRSGGGFSFNFGASNDQDMEMESDTSSNPDTQRNNTNISQADGHEEREEGRGLQEGGSVEVKLEDIPTLLSGLPSRIAYTTSTITSARRKRQLRVRRRALFDVKMQLMAEDEAASPPPTAASTSSEPSTGADPDARSGGVALATPGLADSDLTSYVYEGGFKTWECALSLASYLLDHAPEDGSMADMPEEVVELGCGTAIPSLIIFTLALQSKRDLRLVLADYNTSVLRLVTLPNLLLAWAGLYAPELFTPEEPRERQTLDSRMEDEYNAEELDEEQSGDRYGVRQNSRQQEQEQEGDKGDEGEAREEREEKEEEEEGDLEVTEALLSSFIAHITSPTSRQQVSVVSGPWGSELETLITSSLQRSEQQAQGSAKGDGRLILASETIYSPTSLSAFTQLLVNLLHTGKRTAASTVTETGIIAAKKMYFGVGGGVHEFLAALRSAPLPPGTKSVDVQDEAEAEAEARVQAGDTVGAAGLGVPELAQELDPGPGLARRGEKGVQRCILRVSLVS